MIMNVKTTNGNGIIGFITCHTHPSYIWDLFFEDSKETCNLKI